MPKSLSVGIMVLSAAITGCSGGSGSLPQSSTAVQSSAAAHRTASTSATTRKTASNGVTNAYATAVLAGSPLAYYQLADQNATMSDSGPNSLAGTYGSSVVTNAPAITNGGSGAAVFPGGTAYNPSGYAFTPMSAALQPAQVTLEAWFVLGAHNGTSHDIPLVVYGSVGRQARYGLFLHGLGASGDCLEYQQQNVGQTAGLVHWTTTHLTVGQTYHVVVANNAGTISVYMNGVLDSTVAYAGNINYTTYFVDGLQIGGADQGASWGSASFPGTVAQVALYSAPLTQAQVTAHFLAGQIIPMVSETPSNADSFVDSIGVNAHFDNAESLYATNYSTVSSMLIASGIRHIREAITYNNASYLQEMQNLAAAGIHANYLTQLNLTQAQIQSWPSLVGSSIESFEPPNEQDDVGNSNWLPECIAFQQNLYSWVKSGSLTANLPVLAPAIVNLNDFPLVGNQSAYLDAGNIHDYMSFFNPGTIGWGSYDPPYGNYGSIQYNVNLGKVISGNKPMIATETGYGTVAGNPLTVDYRTHLRYMTRLFFEQFNGGIKRTYTYELIDEGGSAVFANYGLLQTDLQPKPAFTGVSSLISALSDPGTPFTTTPLSYNLSGFINNVQHTLLQKRNGQYVMAIWLEVPDWITANNAGGDIIVPNQSVTLTTAKNFSAASYSTMDENGNMTTAPLTWSGSSATVSVSDKVSLITLTP